MNYTFLLADDCESKITMLTELIRSSAIEAEIHVARDTNEAIRIVDTKNIQMALIDYEIPTHNGPHVIAYLRKKNPDAYIACVSASSREEYILDAKKAGADKYICTSNTRNIVEKEMNDTLFQWSIELQDISKST